MNNPKRHHFVPAFFINFFTENGSEGECVWIHDFKRTKTRYATPRSLLSENSLYSFEDVPRGQRNDLERAFCHFEGECHNLISMIVGAHRLPSGEGLLTLLRFVAFMSLRNPLSRMNYFEFNNKINQRTLSQKDCEKVFQNDWLVGMIEGVDKMTDMLKLARWDLVYVPPELGTIVCPDNPVVFNDSSCPMNIYFPLNKNHLLHASFNGVGAPDIRTREQLAWLNSTLIEYASNVVISTNEEVLFMLGDKVLFSNFLANIRR